MASLVVSSSPAGGAGAMPFSDRSITARESFCDTERGPSDSGGGDVEGIGRAHIRLGSRRVTCSKTLTQRYPSAGTATIQVCQRPHCALSQLSVPAASTRACPHKNSGTHASGSVPSTYSLADVSDAETTIGGAANGLEMSFASTRSTPDGASGGPSAVARISRPCPG